MTTQNRENWPRLMQKAQNGDERAYTQLLKEIIPVLRKFLFRRLFNKNNTEDILQDILVGLHRARHTYRPDQPFDRWLFGIARHKTIDAMRKYYRQEKKEVLSENNETFFTTDTNNQLEAVKDLNEALKRLNAQQRKIVTMAKIDGYSMAEIAKTCNMTESAVKVTVHRATKKMKQWLVQHGYE